MKLNSGTLDYEASDNLSWNRDYGIDMFASWTVLPRSWEGNSEFDKNYNIIRIWEPIQIEVWDNKIIPTNFKITLKVPSLGATPSALSWGLNLKVINWQLSWQNDILNASWSYIVASEIGWATISLWSKDWLTLDNSPEKFSNFYSSNCITWISCKLKMSVISKLETTTSQSIPYLEWKIYAWWNIPLRYRIINTTWKSYGFRKDLNVKVPQQTVNEAFDFTVFQ
jgi:hypothetical protein